MASKIERLSVAEIEQAIESEEHSLSFLLGKRDQLSGEKSRVSNAALGLSGETQGYAIQGREDEAKRFVEKEKELSQKLSAIELEIEEKRENLRTLKAEMDASEPAVLLQQRQLEYVALAKRYREMEARRVGLVGERDRSTGALRAVEVELNAAERKRSRALSLEEVSAASSEEAEAQASKSNIEGLLKNIETALAALDTDMRSALDDLAGIKKQVCEASVHVGVKAIQQSPAFREIKEQVEETFAASMLADAYGGSLSQFLLHVFNSQGGTIEGGFDRIGALQAEVALQLGVAE